MHVSDVREQLKHEQYYHLVEFLVEGNNRPQSSPWGFQYSDSQFDATGQGELPVLFEVTPHIFAELTPVLVAFVTLSPEKTPPRARPALGGHISPGCPCIPHGQAALKDSRNCCSTPVIHVLRY